MDKMIMWLITVLAICTLAWITLELWRIQRVIASERLTRIMRKWFYTFLGFTILRILGAVADWSFGLTVRWYTALAFFIMHGYIIFSLYSQRKVIEASEVDSITGRRRISSKMDDVLVLMKGREHQLTAEIREGVAKQLKKFLGR